MRSRSARKDGSISYRRVRTRHRRVASGHARITVPPVMIRTTSDGIATGAGPTPDDALSELTDLARPSLERMTAQAVGDDADTAATATWGIEVVDVRLAAGLNGMQEPGWIAYGTVRTTGLSPLAQGDSWRARSARPLRVPIVRWPVSPGGTTRVLASDGQCPGPCVRSTRAGAQEHGIQQTITRPGPRGWPCWQASVTSSDRGGSWDRR